MAAFQLCFSIKKGIFKKKVSGEIAFELIIFFHGQTQEPTIGQLPQKHLSILKNLLILLSQNI